MFTVRNAVLLALMQVGVIVAGVLGAGASYKWWKEMLDLETIPPSLLTMTHYGPFLLGVPIIWTISALVVRVRPEISEDAKSLAFLSGIIILGCLILLIGYVVLHPWLNVDWRIGGGHDA